MEEEKKLEKRKNIEIAVLSIIIVVLLGALIYLLFIKNDEEISVNNDENNQTSNNINQTDEKYLIMLNDGLRDLLFQELTQDEFKEKAKQYCTNELIEKLLKYYNSDTTSVCLNSGGCNIDGGYIGEITDINYRDFKIVSKDATIIEGIGIYGESKDNVKEQKIRYKLDNGTWKIDDFDIINNN